MRDSYTGSFGPSTLQHKRNLNLSSVKKLTFYVTIEPKLEKEVITVNEPYELTCGWLLSEATRRYERHVGKRKETLTTMDTDYCSRQSSLHKAKPNIPKKLIVGLKSSPGEFKIPIDFYLTQHDLPLYRLPDGLELEAHFACISSAQKKKHFVKKLIKEKPHTTEKDFEFLYLIGKGGYSKVVCARKLDSGRLYGIKIMNKSDIEQNLISPRIVLNE